MFFGAFYGLMEFIPYIGPIIGPIPAILVALFNRPDQRRVGDRGCSSPCSSSRATSSPRRCSGMSLRINPILIILSLLIGFELYGIVGSLVALPIAAVIRQTVVYLRRHLVLEPWTMNPVGEPPLVLIRVQSEPERCPGLRRATASGDAFCRSCGASLRAACKHSRVAEAGAQPVALGAVVDEHRHPTPRSRSAA